MTRSHVLSCAVTKPGEDAKNTKVGLTKPYTTIRRTITIKWTQYKTKVRVFE